MKWFYMQAGAMPLLIAALAALYLRPGKRSPPEGRTSILPVRIPFRSMPMTPFRL